MNSAVNLIETPGGVYALAYWLAAVLFISVNKKKYYAFSDSEKEKIIGENPDQKISIQRYKGLGEMNPEQLWETTMDPERRILKKVSINDAEEADKIFTILMGSEVAPRKNFIQTHAKSVKNLDI